MTREEAKELLPIIQALSEGKTIQFLSNGEWIDTDDPVFARQVDNYRIKPEPKYRPFKNKEECWNEMMKHQPVGWVKHHNTICIIQGVLCNGIIYFNMQGLRSLKFEDFEDIKFADGTLFGIKED